VLKTEDYVHSVGYSQRSNVPIEPYLSEQWFMKYPSVDASTKAVEEGRIKFHPERWTKTYLHWMHNIKDWCISRQLWWGHRVPVWQFDSESPTSDAASGQRARKIEQLIGALAKSGTGIGFQDPAYTRTDLAGKTWLSARVALAPEA